MTNTRSYAHGRGLRRTTLTRQHGRKHPYLVTVSWIEPNSHGTIRSRYKALIPALWNFLRGMLTGGTDRITRYRRRRNPRPIHPR